MTSAAARDSRTMDISRVYVSTEEARRILHTSEQNMALMLRTVLADIWVRNPLDGRYKLLPKDVVEALAALPREEMVHRDLTLNRSQAEHARSVQAQRREQQKPKKPAPVGKARVRPGARA